jgi:hypothetical protein
MQQQDLVVHTTGGRIGGRPVYTLNSRAWWVIFFYRKGYEYTSSQFGSPQVIRSTYFWVLQNFLTKKIP